MGRNGIILMLLIVCVKQDMQKAPDGNVKLNKESLFLPFRHQWDVEAATTTAFYAYTLTCLILQSISCFHLDFYLIF